MDSGESTEETGTYVRDWKPRAIMLRGKGYFRGASQTWTSELAYALVLYDPRDDKISVRKRWTQRSKDGDPTWVRPGFDKKTKKRWLKWAREAYLNHYKGSGQGREQDDPVLKGHEQDLCERCEELGYSCNQRRRRKKAGKRGEGADT